MDGDDAKGVAVADSPASPGAVGKVMSSAQAVDHFVRVHLVAQQAVRDEFERDFFADSAARRRALVADYEAMVERYFQALQGQDLPSP